MLFEFENILDTVKNEKTFDLEESFLNGNSFKNLYEPYKNYKPKDIMVCNEKDAYLVKLMMLDFGITDLNLKLALEPNNKELYEKFMQYCLMYEKSLKEYEKKYQVLEVYDDTLGKYTMNETPWPWEGNYV